MIKVLFVCLGNICRSPMADAIFQDKVVKANLSDKIIVDSAGTGGWHIGEPAHSGTRNILQQHHIPYDGRARQFVAKDAEEFTYILAMDRSNLRDIQTTIGQETSADIQMFLQLAYDADEVDVLEVPDPYYDNRFAHVYALVDKGADALLSYIRTQHNL